MLKAKPKFWTPYRRLSQSFLHNAAASSTKPAVDISSVFPSLSGVETPPLPARFADLKTNLIRGHETAVQASWHRLLRSLPHEVEKIRSLGSAIVPEIPFDELKSGDDTLRKFKASVHKRGVAIVRNVIPEQEALAWKDSVMEHIRKNPSVKGFPPSQPAVYELYWTDAQLAARSHPSLLLTQKLLMSSLFHASSAPFSTSHPVTYADRLRIRQPGDAGFNLGPHMDGGNLERWEPSGYGGSGPDGVYTSIFTGNWESYDPWSTDKRPNTRSSLYPAAGGCSVWRMCQGWLSLSNTGPGEGTLKIYPLLRHTTAYTLLRPFFAPLKPDPSATNYLDPSNWVLETPPSSSIQGAVPGTAQELSPLTHPHLFPPHPSNQTVSTMPSIPRVNPGDYVLWHSDSVHAVESLHAGQADSSVLYIPLVPLTAANAAYLVKQREAFWQEKPGPDFWASSTHSPDFTDMRDGRSVPEWVTDEGRRSMGVMPLNVDSDVQFEDPNGMKEGVRRIVREANSVLGFA